MALGKNIKRHREARGWDQKTLSKLSGVPVVTISAMEVRDSKRSDKAVELARAFGISVEDLISPEYGGPVPEQTQPVAEQVQPEGIRQTIDRLGQLLVTADDRTRAAVAELLLRYAQNPADGERLAQAIEVLMTGSAPTKDSTPPSARGGHIGRSIEYLHQQKDEHLL